MWSCNLPGSHLHTMWVQDGPGVNFVHLAVILTLLVEKQFLWLHHKVSPWYKILKCEQIQKWIYNCVCVPSCLFSILWVISSFELNCFQMSFLLNRDFKLDPRMVEDWVWISFYSEWIYFSRHNSFSI